MVLNDQRSFHFSLMLMQRIFYEACREALDSNYWQCNYPLDDQPGQPT
jgi:hypothetical protein